MSGSGSPSAPLQFEQASHPPSVNKRQSLTPPLTGPKSPQLQAKISFGVGSRSAPIVTPPETPNFQVLQVVSLVFRRIRILSLFTFGLLRRIRMRGRERVDMAFAFSAAACNLVRLPKLLAEPVVA